MKLDRQEIARYLGYGRTPMPPEVSALAETCMEELERTVIPRSLGRRMAVRRFTEASRDLAYQLRHCEEAVLYAITLGPQADLLLRRWSVRDMAKAAVGQAVCAAWLDQLAADYVEGLDLGAGEYPTPPFSPGYGDLKLETQKEIFKQLDCTKRIGITLTEDMLMYPTKSVTALIGLTDEKEECHTGKCKQCTNTECEFRDEV